MIRLIFDLEPYSYDKQAKPGTFRISGITGQESTFTYSFVFKVFKGRAATDVGKRDIGCRPLYGLQSEKVTHVR